MRGQALHRGFWSLATLLLATSLSAQEPAANAGPQATAPEPSAEQAAATEEAQEDTTPSVPAQFDVELDRQEITVGGRVKATLTLVWMGAEPASPARFPTWQETWGKAEVLTTSPVEAFVDQSGRHIYRQELQLTAFDVGEVRLPSVDVALPFAEHTMDLSTEGGTTFEVVSVLPPEPDPAANAPGAAPGGPGGTPPAGPPGTGPPRTGPPGSPDDPAAAEAPELRPAAQLQALPAQQLFWWVTGILALACGLAALAVDRRLGYLPTEASAPKPLLPPYDEFVQQLVELDPLDTEPTHTALSLGLRRYLGRSLGFQATESTTSEIQRRLRETSVGAAGAQPFIQLFRACDQVKFARQQVAPEVTRDRLRQARQLAQDVEASLQPEPEDSADPSGNNPASPQGRIA